MKYLNETNQTRHRSTKGVLEKLRENVDKAVGDRTTTAEKRLQGHERRDRLLNYAKNNIPKPTVKEKGFQPKLSPNHGKSKKVHRRSLSLNLKFLKYRIKSFL